MVKKQRFIYKEKIHFHMNPLYNIGMSVVDKYYNLSKVAKAAVIVTGLSLLVASAGYIGYVKGQQNPIVEPQRIENPVPV